VTLLQPALGTNGGSHSAELFRQAQRDLNLDNQGIAGGTDLKVRAKSTPGAGIVVGPGAGWVIGKVSALQGTYYVSNPDDDNSASTGLPGSGGTTKSVLVMLRVEDPQYEGSKTVNTMNSIYTVACAPGATGDVSGLITGIPLARIDYPANTSTITSGMIVDLRAMANPRRQRVLSEYHPTAVEDWGGSTRNLWPFGAFAVFTPHWATNAIVVATMSQIQYTAPLTGVSRVEYGWNTAAPADNPNSLDGMDSGHHLTAAGPLRATVAIAASFGLPLSYRNRYHFLRVGSLVNAGSTGILRADTFSAVVFDMEFFESPT
jgi:hypothetical protein